MKQLLPVAGLLILALSIQAQNKKKDDQEYIPSDTAAGPLSAYDYEQRYKKIKCESLYLTMRDSVQIACNYCIPKKLPEGKKLPTVLVQTRYWRGAQFRWPFSMFLDNFIGREGKMIEKVIQSGYAFVVVDARGSGASTGQRDHPWTEDEVKDGAEVVDWIIEQPWSDGKVGSAGASYTGTTAEFLLVNQHPNVKAIVTTFALFDVYDDISFPGGINFEYFTNNWGDANAALDRDELPAKVKKGRFVVKGVQRVKGEKKTFKKAQEDHKKNLSVKDGAKGIVYRDDRSKNRARTQTDAFSPHSYAEQINNSGAAIYAISGWMDGNYQHAAVKKYLTYTNPDNKLLLGPWEHGGAYNCSPFNEGPAGFDLAGEIIKFFDYHLKGVDNGLYDEAPIHYFNMGREEWVAADTWPPGDTEYLEFYLAEDNTLQRNKPDYPGEILYYDTYEVDTTFGTGIHSRWRSVFGSLYQPETYPDFHERSEKLLTYVSEPVQQDMEITGHPYVKLYAGVNDTDATYYVYLMDVDSDGYTTYITEGHLRALHRKLDVKHPAYDDVVPYRSFEKEDAEPMPADGSAEPILFDLLPTSYTLKKGHRLAIGIGTHDKHHFKLLDPDGEIYIYRSEENPSMISIPVIPKE